MTTWWVSTASVLTAVVVSELLESQSSVHLDADSALHHQLPLRMNLLKSATTMPAVMGSMMLIIAFRVLERFVEEGVLDVTVPTSRPGPFVKVVDRGGF